MISRYCGRNSSCWESYGALSLDLCIWYSTLQLDVQNSELWPKWKPKTECGLTKIQTAAKSKGKVKIRSVYRPMPAHTQNQECSFLLSSRKQLNECRLRIRSGRYDGILMMKLRKWSEGKREKRVGRARGGVKWFLVGEDVDGGKDSEEASWCCPHLARPLGD